MQKQADDTPHSNFPFQAAERLQARLASWDRLFLWYSWVSGRVRGNLLWALCRLLQHTVSPHGWLPEWDGY